MKKFTLIELLIVVVVIGTLAAMILPTTHHHRRKSKMAQCKSNLKQIGTSTVMYFTDILTNPPNVPNVYTNIKGSTADPTNFNDPTIFSDSILTCPAITVSYPPTDGYRWHAESRGKVYDGSADSKLAGDEAPTNHRLKPYQFHVYQDGHVDL